MKYHKRDIKHSVVYRLRYGQSRKYIILKLILKQDNGGQKPF